MNPCPHNAIWFHPVSNCPFHKPPNVQTSNDTRPATVRPLQSHPVNAEVLQEAQRSLHGIGPVTGQEQAVKKDCKEGGV